MNAFLLEPEIIGPFELKPWTFFTQSVVSQLSGCNFTEVEQMAAFAWIQSRDKSEVKKAIAKKTVEAEIKAFSEDIPLSVAKAISDWATRQSDLIQASQVEVIPKLNSDGDEPKN
jgi:hypothetical protein